MSKLWLSIAVFLANVPTGVSACDYPQLELQGLSPRAAVNVPVESLQVHLTLKEVQIAGPDQHRNNIWFAVRGTVIEGQGQLAAGQSVVIPSVLRTTCFFPGKAYQFSKNGELLVWVLGRFEIRNGVANIIPPVPQPTHLNRQSGLHWVKVRWENPE